MIATLGLLAGRTWRHRAGYAALAFGIWDIFYYVFLWGTIVTQSRETAADGRWAWAGDLLLPRRLDERVHMLEILFERSPPGRAQPIVRPRRAARKRLLA